VIERRPTSITHRRACVGPTPQSEPKTKEDRLRIGMIAANAIALVFCLALCAAFVWLLGRVGFLGALITGLVVLAISYTVELEDGSAIGSDYTPGLYASQRRYGGTPEERAAREAERAELRSILNGVRHAGAALVTVGALGFFFFQL
jgi:hypothetical protein